MKKISRTGLSLLLVATIVFSCKEKSAEIDEAADAVMTEAVDTAATDSEAASVDKIISSSAAKEDPNSKRKFIRTADIKCKVRDVAKSTYVIEDVTSNFGGFVASTDLKSNIIEEDKTKVSQDSTLITTKYAVTNDITIRVPNKQLDTVLKSIAKQISFLDYRVIKADDVSLKLLANEMSQKRGQNSANRIERAIDSKGKKLDNVIDAEESLATKRESQDNSKIENLSLKDQVNFSTVTLALYQNDSVKQELVANEKPINAYRPNIGLQIWDSLKTGWFILESVIAFVVQLWGIGLLLFLAWFGYKKLKTKSS
ncbi:MAG: DUF4349 domain-containing protein [Limnohabitans sp.]|nr:DUF4349 domain-containing protein [Limnohabitans sp.]